MIPIALFRWSDEGQCTPSTSLYEGKRALLIESGFVLHDTFSTQTEVEKYLRAGLGDDYASCQKYINTLINPTTWRLEVYSNQSRCQAECAKVKDCTFLICQDSA